MKKKVITLLLFTSFLYTSSVNAEKIWEDMDIELPNGKHIWAKVNKRNDGCYSLLLGGSGMNGTGVNCSSSLRGNWSVTACSTGGVLVYGGVNKVINNIVNRCN